MYLYQCGVIIIKTWGVSIFIEFIATPLPTNHIFIEKLRNTVIIICIYTNNIKWSPCKPVKNWQSIGLNKFNWFHGIKYKSHEKYKKSIVWCVQVLQMYCTFTCTCIYFKQLGKWNWTHTCMIEFWSPEVVQFSMLNEIGMMIYIYYRFILSIFIIFDIIIFMIYNWLSDLCILNKYYIHILKTWSWV